MTYATLSPLEQKIWFAARNARDGVVLLEIIRSWGLTDRRTLLFSLSRMVKKGWLLRLRNGVYLVSEPGMAQVKDPFAISTYIFPGYNAFSSALYIHGLSDMVPFEVFVATRNESRRKTIREHSFRAIALKGKYGGSESRNGILVSTRAKTFYDCLTHPEFCGGFPQILRALNDARLGDDEWGELLNYAEKHEANAFFQRLGYLLGLLPKKGRAVLDVIRRCRKRVKSKVYLFRRKKGRYYAEWRVVDDVGREALLAWWY